MADEKEKDIDVEVVETDEGSGPPEGTQELKPENFRGSFSTGEPPAAPPAPVEPEPPAQPATTGEPEPPKGGIDSVIKRLREEASVELKSEDDIVEEIKSSRGLKAKVQEVETRLSSFDPLAVDIDRAIKAGVDVDTYLETRKMDIEKMDNKEAIRLQFMIENDKLVKTDPELARLKFERDQRSKYPVLFEELTEEEKELKRSEIEYATRSLKADAIVAKEFLADYKKKNVTLPEPKDTTQEVKEYWDRYLAGAEAYHKGVESLEIPIEGGESFKLGVEEFAGEIHDKLKNPIDTLLELGIDVKTGGVDPEKLGDTLLKIKALEQIGPRLSKWLLEQQASREVRQTLVTAPPQPPAGGNLPPIDDHDTKVAKAFRAKRDADRRG